MKTWIMVGCAALVAVVSAGCRTPAPASQSGESAPPAELLQTNTLSEVVRHLYRWYMDENDVERIANDRDLVFRVRRVPVKLTRATRASSRRLPCPSWTRRSCSRRRTTWWRKRRPK